MLRRNVCTFNVEWKGDIVCSFSQISGSHLVAGKCFSCCVKSERMKVYRTFNAVYYRSKGINTELTTLHLVKSYCLPFILYGTEAVSLNKSAINKLDNCIKLAVAKIFNVKDGNIDAVREYCDLQYIGDIIEKDVYILLITC